MSRQPADEGRLGDGAGLDSVVDPSCAESAPTEASGTKIHATALCPEFETPGGLRFTPTDSAVTRPSEMKVRSLATHSRRTRVGDPQVFELCGQRGDGRVGIGRERRELARYPLSRHSRR